MRASNAEWDFMGRSFLVWSLANIGLREPASKAVCLETMDRIIAETLRLEQERGCACSSCHMPNLIHTWCNRLAVFSLTVKSALMLGSRRLLEEKSECQPLLAERVAAVAEGLERSPRMVLESYPHEGWTFDHCVALAAIRLADRLDGSDRSALVRN